MDVKFYILPCFPIEGFTMFNINISGYFQLLEILILNTHNINVTARFHKMLIRLLKNAKEKVTLYNYRSGHRNKLMSDRLSS